MVTLTNHLSHSFRNISGNFGQSTPVDLIYSFLSSSFFTSQIYEIWFKNHRTRAKLDFRFSLSSCVCHFWFVFNFYLFVKKGSSMKKIWKGNTDHLILYFATEIVMFSSIYHEHLQYEIIVCLPSFCIVKVVNEYSFIVYYNLRLV